MNLTAWKGAGKVAAASQSIGAIKRAELPRSETSDDLLADETLEEDEGANDAFDDYSSPMDLTVYMNVRGRNYARRLEGAGPLFARWNTILETIALLFQASAGILGTLGYAIWAPIPVAIAIVVIGQQDFHAVQAQLVGTSEGSCRLHHVLSWWDSLSLIQKKTRDTKARSVTEVEEAIMLPIEAKTAAAAAGPAKKKKKKPGFFGKIVKRIKGMCGGGGKKKKAKKAAEA